MKVPQTQDPGSESRAQVTAPVPAGAAMFRDHRAWHGRRRGCTVIETDSRSEVDSTARLAL
jgi:hypothetical protein